MHIYRWDLDKTYLKTQFDTLGEIVRTALEAPAEKANIPGTAALMRCLRYGIDGTENRVYVVSGSPREMRRVLTEKLRLDGVSIDGLELKPNLSNLLRGRFRAIRDQLGYKLPILLESRAGMDRATTALETCFGDDAEMDAIIYRLYGDIADGSITPARVEALLTEARLYPDQIARIRAAAEKLPIRPVVERVFIHLETGSPTGRFEPLGPRVAPTFNAFQSAMVLHGDGRLSRDSVMVVVEEMVDRYGYTTERLSASIQDALRRDLVSRELATPIGEALRLNLGPEWPVRARSEAPVDYPALLADVEVWHKERKARRRPSGGLSALFGKG